MQSLNSALVGYWPLGDQSGSRLDLTANNLLLSNVGVATSVDGFIGQATNFTGGSRLSLSSNAAIQGGPKDYTFACWVNFASVSASVYGLLSKSDGTAGHKEYILHYTGSGTDRLTFTVYRATDSAQVATANNFGSVSANTGKWLFICAWNDHTNLTVNIEVNAGDTDSTALAGATQAASTAGFIVAADDLTPTNPLTGTMEEMAKWERVLTRQERTWLYNKGRGRTFPFDGHRSLGLGRHARSRRMAGML